LKLVLKNIPTKEV